MIVFYFILVALGVFKVTEWTQEIMTWAQRSWFVSVTAGVFSCSGVLLLPVTFTTKSYFLYALGVWGASAFLHAIESLLRSHKELANSNWLKAQKSSRTPGW